MWTGESKMVVGVNVCLSSMWPWDELVPHPGWPSPNTAVQLSTEMWRMFIMYADILKTSTHKCQSGEYGINLNHKGTQCSRQNITYSHTHTRSRLKVTEGPGSMVLLSYFHQEQFGCCGVLWPWTTFIKQQWHFLHTLLGIESCKLHPSAK